MAVLKSAEVRHCYPSILVLLLRVAWRETRFSGKCKFSDTVGVHLLGVRAVERVLGDLTSVLRNVLRLRLSSCLIQVRHWRNDCFSWAVRLGLSYALRFLNIPGLIFSL